MKKLYGGNADHAGGALKGKPRVVRHARPGELLVPGVGRQRRGRSSRRPARSRATAGLRARPRHDVEPGDADHQPTSRADGITTIICGCDPILPVFLSGVANREQYYPEFIIVGTALTDADIVGQLWNQNFASHAFGVSPLDGFVPPTADDRLRRLQVGAPTTSPPSRSTSSTTRCTCWRSASRWPARPQPGDLRGGHVRLPGQDRSVRACGTSARVTAPPPTTSARSTGTPRRSRRTTASRARTSAPTRAPGTRRDQIPKAAPGRPDQRGPDMTAVALAGHRRLERAVPLGAGCHRRARSRCAGVYLVYQPARASGAFLEDKAPVRHRRHRRHLRHGQRAARDRPDPHLPDEPVHQLRLRVDGQPGRRHRHRPAPREGLAVLRRPCRSAWSIGMVTGARRSSWSSGGSATRRGSSSPWPASASPRSSSVIEAGIAIKALGFVSLTGGFKIPLELGDLDLGVKTLFGDEILIMLVVPPVLAGLAWFLLRPTSGVAVRAAAENEDRALLLGIPIRRLSTIVWMIAGGLAALTFVLKAPFAGVTPGSAGAGTAAPAARAGRRGRRPHGVAAHRVRRRHRPRDHGGGRALEHAGLADVPVRRVPRRDPRGAALQSGQALPGPGERHVDVVGRRRPQADARSSCATCPRCGGPRRVDRRLVVAGVRLHPDLVVGLEPATSPSVAIVWAHGRRVAS